MAYVVACLLLVLLAQSLDSYPRGADVKGQDQDRDLRELIKDLIKLKAGDNDQRSALHGKGKEEERNEMNINPDSELEYLLLTFQVDEHGIKQRAENLHSDTERVKGEEHDIHPTPPEDTVESQRQLNGHGFTRRNFIKDINKLWPGGIVPYEIDAGSFSDEDISVIQGAMEEVQSKTCIKFQPFDTDSSSTLGHNAYILFTNAEGCWSYVGKISNGKQDIGLDTRYCVSNPTVIHELCHALGMEHEQSRPDRDNYVTILWNNTIDGEDNGNMVKYDTDETNPYDYESLLQYRLKAFAIDSSDYTIRFHDRELEFLAGLAKELTFYDVMDITAAYHCTDKCGADTPRCQNGGFVNHHCECTCPEHLHGVDCSSVETNSGCGGIVDITSGPRTIQSPNYPQNYSKELCTWLVQVWKYFFFF
ncbi:blastula protease 10-like [Ylistrum balloti]|uniref:blastula protease 10-like n=1 Tax=Ylistrum balloti TaxID=509963 RepID=UPI002905E469|nr:blastula protease 10-like [Ylistrum balloti]